MKKILLTGIVVIVTFGLVYAGFRYDNTTSGTWKLVDTEGNTMEQIVDNGTTGNKTITGNLTVDGTLDMTNGIVNIHETWLTVASSDTTKHFDVNITTISLIAGATTITLAKGDIVMAEHPRNVIADIDFATSEATSTYVGSMVITGVDTLGESAEETLTLSTNSVTGNVAWSKITQVVITATTINTTDANVNLELGTGVKLGLANDITASGDIYKIVEGSSDVQTGGTINTTYNTYLPATTPSATNYELWYKAKGRD